MKLVFYMLVVTKESVTKIIEQLIPIETLNSWSSFKIWPIMNSQMNCPQCMNFSTQLFRFQVPNYQTPSLYDKSRRKQWVNGFLSKGFIYKNLSPHTLSTLPTIKKDKSWRMCFNRRIFNKIVDKYRFIIILLTNKNMSDRFHIFLSLELASYSKAILVWRLFKDPCSIYIHIGNILLYLLILIMLLSSYPKI